jgi:rare lipoprotein A
VHAKDTSSNAERHSETGFASYYAKRFEGRRTASGKTFRHSELMAAHNGLPFGTLVRVTNLRNDSSVDVRIADRGGFGKGGSLRIIDLSRAAAAQLSMIAAGQARVLVEVLEWGKDKGRAVAEAVREQIHPTNAPEVAEIADAASNLQVTSPLIAVKQDSQLP